MEIFTAAAYLVLLLLFLLLKPYVVGFWVYMRKVYKLPMTKTHFIFGHSWFILNVAREKFYQVVVDVLKMTPPLFVIWAGPIPAVGVTKPEHIEVILSSTKSIDKPIYYKFLEPWLGTGLLLSSGDKWQLHRKMLTPAFHFTILESFVEIFAEKSKILVKRLQREVGSERFDVYPYITKCTLDIICETAMGVDIKAQEMGRQSDYVEAVEKILCLVMNRLMSPWLYLDFIYYLTPQGRQFKKHVKTLHSFTRKVIKEKKQRYYSDSRKHCSEEKELRVLGKKKKLVLMDILLESAYKGEKITDEEIREEVDTFMFEGHDTTATNICWTLQFLASHPDVQGKVYDELSNIFQGSDRAPNMKDLNDMKYLETVIKETLRLFPSIPVIARELKEDVEVDGHILPAGICVVIVGFYTHRNAQHFPDPDNFNPDNFLPENVKNRHPYAYIPFSAGPRNCIGQKFALLEEKMILSYILRHYMLEGTGEFPIPLPGVVLKSVDGFHHKIVPRHAYGN